MGYKKLFKLACEKNDSDAISFLLERKKGIMKKIGILFNYIDERKHIHRYCDIQTINEFRDSDPFRSTIGYGIMNLIEYGCDLRLVCVGGDIERVKAFMKNGDYCFDFGLAGACRGGHMDIVNFMIENGANNWEGGLSEACRGGHMDIVNFMIEKGANNYTHAFNSACEGWNMDIVKLMVEKSSIGSFRTYITGLMAGRPNNWNLGLNSACKSGNIDIANLMMKNGATRSIEGMVHACHNGHIELNDILKLRHNLEEAFTRACETGNVMIVKALFYKTDYHEMGLYAACEKGHLDVVRFIIEVGGVRIERHDNQMDPHVVDYIHGILTHIAIEQQRRNR